MGPLQMAENMDYYGHLWSLLPLSWSYNHYSQLIVGPTLWRSHFFQSMAFKNFTPETAPAGFEQEPFMLKHAIVEAGPPQKGRV